MIRFISIGLMIAFLSGCSMVQPSHPSVSLAPGATAFSGGYGGGGYGEGQRISGPSHWTEVVLGLGLVAALVGGCFAVKTAQGEEICFSILEGIFAY